MENPFSTSQASSAVQATADESAPWIEKYRPQRIRDICHQEAVKRTLENIVKTNAMPHLLFFGPPGTGKTTAILALCRELFGPSWRKRVRELNASDDRGIKAVRGSVKSFAEQLPAQIPAREDGTQPPPFKIIILDEADMMTVDAQSCLRRVMEDHCQHTRFVLICNYVTSIISPIQSRCASYRFQPISEASQKERLKLIGVRERFEITDAAIDQLVFRSGGDMRVAIVTLYTLHCAGKTALDDAQIDTIMGYPDPSVTSKIIDVVTSGAVQDINRIVEDVIADGWDLELLFKSILERVVVAPNLTDVQKAMIGMSLANAQSGLMKGVKPYCAMMTVALEINSASAKSAV